MVRLIFDPGSLQVSSSKDFYEKYNPSYVGAKFGYVYGFDSINAARLYISVDSHALRPRIPVQISHVDINLDYIYKFDISRSGFDAIYAGLFIGDAISDRVYDPISDIFEYGLNLGYMAFLNSKHILEVGFRYFVNDSILFTQGEENGLNSYFFLNEDGVVVGRSEQSPYIFTFGLSYGYLF